MMRHFNHFIVFSSLLLSLGCSDESEPQGATGTDGPLVAGTPATDSVADAPARCGKAPHQWLRTGPLGEIGEYGPLEKISLEALNARVADYKLILPAPPRHPVSLRQFTYQTQDRGKLIEASALIAYPEGSFDSPRNTMLLLHGTSGFVDGCGVSDSDKLRLFASLYATQGYIAVMPDYLGLKELGGPTGFVHPYLVGEATAIASLDSVRAIHRMPPEERGGHDVSNQFVSVGGSQGGHAALWLDRLAPYYARELHQRGILATVPATDLITHIERALTIPVEATINTIGFFFTAPQWYGYTERLGEFFQPSILEPLAAAAGSCPPTAPSGVSSLADIFTPAALDAARAGTFRELDPWGCMAAENSLLETSIERIDPGDPSYGIFVITGESDTLVHTPIERDAFRTLCERGLPIKYLECTGADHFNGTDWSIPENLEFVAARFAGEPFDKPASCEPPAPVRCQGTPPSL